MTGAQKSYIHQSMFWFVIVLSLFSLSSHLSVFFNDIHRGNRSVSVQLTFFDIDSSVTLNLIVFGYFVPHRSKNLRISSIL